MANWWIKERLEALGKTGVGLANALGVASARTTEIYKGDRKVQSREIQPLARFLEMPVAEVMEKLGLSPAHKAISAPTEIDADLLAEIAHIVDLTLAENDLTLDPRVKFLMISRTYEALARRGKRHGETTPSSQTDIRKNKHPSQR